MPFPFLPFPDGTPSSNLDEGDNEDNKENVATTEATTKDDEGIVDVADAEFKNEIETEKGTKNGPSNS
jgi:hypothetical protein